MYEMVKQLDDVLGAWMALSVALLQELNLSLGLRHEHGRSQTRWSKGMLPGPAQPPTSDGCSSYVWGI